jgi:branched-chain amino acid transport system permease protein
VKLVLQYTLDAISLGSTFALSALGIALIFSLMRLINFAHGELIVGGGYAMWLLASVLHLVWPVAMLGTVLVVAALAIVIERVAFRPLRSANPAILLVSSFAVAFLLQSAYETVFSNNTLSVELPSFLSSTISVAGLQFTAVNIFGLTVDLLLIGALALFLKRTPLGVRMLASAEDFQMAQLLGVRADVMIAVAFGISGVFAGTLSLLLLAQVGAVAPSIGLNPLLIAFVAIVIGGVGSLVGSVVGGFLLGFIITALQVGLPPNWAPYRDAFTFTAVILILLLRPQGLLGTQARETQV